MTRVLAIRLEGTDHQNMGETTHESHPNDRFVPKRVTA